MQPVSTAYREAMAKPLRNRGYIRVLLSIVDTNAQNNGQFDSDASSNTSVYSTPDNLFKNQLETTHYVTLEQNWSRVDGTMFIPPANTGTGFVTKESASFMSSVLFAGNSREVVVTYPAASFSGLTLNFGDNYATDFTVTFSTGQVITVTGNTSSMWVYSEAIPTNTGFTLSVTAMRRQYTRVRLYSIWLGSTKLFDNDIVVDSNIRYHCSPISEDCPTTDFMVKVYDTSFNPADPDSIVYYLEAGQPITVEYGIELDDGGIEWVDGGTLELEDWDYTGNYATLNGVDAFRHLSVDYPFNGYHSGVYLNDQLADLFTYAGVSADEYILNGVRQLSESPIPSLSVREAIQAICNAWMETIFLDRNGIIRIDDYTGDQYPTNDFYLSNDDIYSKPKITVERPIKTLRTTQNGYTLLSSPTTILSTTVTATANTERVFSWTGDYGDVSITVNGGTTGFTVTAENENNITVLFSQTFTNAPVVIQGDLAQINNNPYEVTISPKGILKQWTNPANGSDYWGHRFRYGMRDYLSSNIEVECETRGFPELEPGDVIQIEDEFRPNFLVRLEDVSLRFNGAFRGTLSGKMVGGDN